MDIICFRKWNSFIQRKMDRRFWDFCSPLICLSTIKYHPNNYTIEDLSHSWTYFFHMFSSWKKWSEKKNSQGSSTQTIWESWLSVEHFLTVGYHHTNRCTTLATNAKNRRMVPIRVSSKWVKPPTAERIYLQHRGFCLKTFGDWLYSA